MLRIHFLHCLHSQTDSLLMHPRGSFPVFRDPQQLRVEVEGMVLREWEEEEEGVQKLCDHPLLLLLLLRGE